MKSRTISPHDEALMLGAIRELLEDGVPELGDEYYYAHLPLCVIDAVFSIGIRYAATQNAVMRYAQYFGLTPYRKNRQSLPEANNQQDIGSFITLWKSIGADEMASIVFVNRCRTSARNGILKAEAAGLYAEVLFNNGIVTLQDAQEKLPNSNIEQQLMHVHGQGSGISTSYFLMLSGSDNHLKADRWLCRFVDHAVGRSIDPTVCESLIRAAHRHLKTEHPGLTLRALDYAIWSNMSGQKN